MLNRVTLAGRLVADPELKHTQTGTAVISIRIAVDRDFRDSDGNRKADFITVVAWRQTAEFIAQYFAKGRMIVVDGKIQVMDYTDKDGNRRNKTEVKADSVYFGDSKKEADGDDPARGFEDIGDDDDLPF